MKPRSKSSSRSLRGPSPTSRRSPIPPIKVLARQARDAKEGLPADLKPVAPLLDDYRQALGLSFDIEDEKGDRFFRSSLIQTAFYSLFAAWILWDRTHDAARFDLEKAQAHLRIPFLEQLFYDIRHPHYLHELGLARHLERAVATLNRVDRKLFGSRMSFPMVDDESPAVAAITYFYEPFLEAFDPQLREELGVWYTPPEIVRYQVRRIHHILKTDSTARAASQTPPLLCSTHVAAPAPTSWRLPAASRRNYAARATPMLSASNCSRPSKSA
jgi:hypothetical protein